MSIYTILGYGTYYTEFIKEMARYRSSSVNTATYHGGYWSRGQTYTAGWYPSVSVGCVIADLSYKLKFVVILNSVKTILKRVAIFRQSRQNKVGIMNLKLQSLL